eukprot:2510214-Ditylum_brightwellii.AAC.1
MLDKAGGGVGKVGVIKIKSFSGTTASFANDVLVDLKKKGPQAFVLDLRNKGGVDTAWFLKDAYQRKRDKGKSTMN